MKIIKGEFYTFQEERDKNNIVCYTTTYPHSKEDKQNNDY
jgi:hypothetical protein